MWAVEEGSGGRDQTENLGFLNKEFDCCRGLWELLRNWQKVSMPQGSSNYDFRSRANTTRGLDFDHMMR
jgi:hypothetical protein